jgi:hypothetical protein
MENRNLIIQGIIFITVILLVSYIVIIIFARKTQSEIILYCHNHNWKGNITGDFTMSCTDIYNIFFKNNQWTQLCSTSFFSSKPSCHDLCNIDCEIKYKEGSEIICLC